MATRAKQFEFLLAGLRDPDTGEPLNGGSVEFYVVGTSTPKNVWTESAKTNAFTSYTLDSNGVAELYGDGGYKVVVKDSGGATEYTFDEVKNISNEYILRTVTSASVTVTPEDDAIMADTSSNSITLNLEAIATFARPILVKKTSASNTVTCDANGSEQIDGSLTYILSADKESVWLVPDNDAGQWRAANDVAINLAGMTTTVAEINASLDGNTATAAEITAVCDGNTATAAEITTACDGITATAADLNKVPGIVSGSQALGGVDCNGNGDISGTLNIGSGATRAVGPKGKKVSNANGNCNISDTVFVCTTSVAEVTWESVGPTGSGADNIWTAMDTIPTDADWIIVRIDALTYDAAGTGTPGNLYALYTYAREDGSSQAADQDNVISRVACVIDSNGEGRASNVAEVTIPISSRKFEINWNETDASSTSVIDIVLVGWGFNP